LLNLEISVACTITMVGAQKSRSVNDLTNDLEEKFLKHQADYAEKKDSKVEEGVLTFKNTTEL